MFNLNIKLSLPEFAYIPFHKILKVKRTISSPYVVCLLMGDEICYEIYKGHHAFIALHGN